MDETPLSPLRLPSESQSPKVHALYEWWLSQIVDIKKYPKWSTVDVISLKDWMGSLVVYGIIDNQSDAVYRLVGTKITQAAGYDLTGKRVSEHSFTRSPGRVLENIKRIVLRETACTQDDSLISNKSGSALTTDRLWLPFSEDDQHVDRLLLYLDKIEYTPPHKR